MTRKLITIQRIVPSSGERFIEEKAVLLCQKFVPVPKSIAVFAEFTLTNQENNKKLLKKQLQFAVHNKSSIVITIPALCNSKSTSVSHISRRSIVLCPKAARSDVQRVSRLVIYVERKNADHIIISNKVAYTYNPAATQKLCNSSVITDDVVISDLRERNFSILIDSSNNLLDLICAKLIPIIENNKSQFADTLQGILSNDVMSAHDILSARNDEGQSLIHMLLQAAPCDWDIVACMLRALVQADLCYLHIDCYAKGVLHYVAELTQGHEILEHLLYNSEFPITHQHLQLRDSKCYTPLHYAVLSRNPNNVYVLMQAGADPTLQGNCDGVTPFHLAVIPDDVNLTFDMLKRLIYTQPRLRTKILLPVAGCKFPVNATTYRGETVLDRVLSTDKFSKYLRVINLLKESGAQQGHCISDDDDDEYDEDYTDDEPDIIMKKLSVVTDKIIECDDVMEKNRVIDDKSNTNINVNDDY